jgi:hypothetical protein
MGWIYFQESEESESHSNLGSGPSLIANGTDTLKAFYCPECNRVTLISLLSGTTLQHLRGKCCRELILSGGDSLVRTSASQDLERVWQESEADFFSKSSDSSRNANLDLFSSKTSPQSEPEAFQPSSQNLPRSGMIAGGRLFLPHRLERRTNETDGFSWHTPKARDWKATGTPEALVREYHRRDSPCLPSTVAFLMWPTPSARDYKGGYQYGRMRNGKVSLDTLDAAVQAYRPGGLLNPDPQAQKSFGQLNPMWVEWLMGYKIGHTELNASGIAWFHCKSARRSKSSQDSNKNRSK